MSPEPSPAPPPGGGSQTLERGLAVLLELGAAPEGLTTSQVAQRCGLHRSITHRLLVSLGRTGFTRRDEDGRHHVGPAARRLADAGRPRLREVAEPVLQRLAREVDATASLVEAVGGAAVATLVAEPPSDGPRFSYRLGNRDPLDRGAGGLAALASAAPRPGEPERVAAVRAAGHVATHAELNPGAHGLAAPLPGWDLPAAVALVTHRAELTTSALPALLRAARDIGAALGDSPA